MSLIKTSTSSSKQTRKQKTPIFHQLNLITHRGTPTVRRPRLLEQQQAAGPGKVTQGDRDGRGPTDSGKDSELIQYPAPATDSVRRARSQQSKQLTLVRFVCLRLRRYCCCCCWHTELVCCVLVTSDRRARKNRWVLQKGCWEFRAANVRSKMF